MAPILVSAVMPCLNEERTLAICIEKAKGAFREMGIVGEVVVADNGSNDRSVAVAESCGARVVHESRKGYGSALMTGIGAARGQFVVMADADDSYDWSQLVHFVLKLEQGYDLVIGNRFLGGIAPGAMPLLHRYLGNPVLSAFARFMYGIPIGDFHCGMRAFRRDAFERIRPRTLGMEFATEMVVNAARGGLRITEIPTRLYPDKRNRPPHLRSFRDGWRHLRFMLSHAPDYLYLWPGLMMLGVGMALMLLLARGPQVVGGQYIGIHFMVVGSMLSLIGTNIMAMGILAKMILWTGHAPASGVLMRVLEHQHLLERMVLAGGLVFLLGFAADLAILLRWLSRAGASMEDTVHLAIMASTLVVLGIEIAFFAFLVFLLRTRNWSRREDFVA